MKRIFWALAALFLVGLGLRTPEFLSDWAVNRAGLDSAHACVAAGSGPTAHGTGVRVEYFSAAAEVCDGGEWSVELLERMLAAHPDRLEIASSITPQEERLARAAVSVDPENPAGYFWLAEIQASNGETGLAIATYRELLELSPRDATAWVELGKLLMTQGDPGQAAHAFDRACELRDLGINGCLNAGYAYFELGNYETAVDRYRQAGEQFGGEFPQALIGQAKALIAMGETEQARDILELLAESGHPDALKLLDSIDHLKP